MYKFILIIILTLSVSFAQNWYKIGPPGGYFKDFAFHPSNKNLIYAGSDDGGGVWKSTNGGADWELITTEFKNMTGWDIEIDPHNPDRIFACEFYSRYGVLKTENGGQTWSVINNGLNTAYDRMVRELVIASADAETLFICTGESADTDPPRPGNGLFKSFNGGQSWQPAGLQGIPTPTMAIDSNKFLYVGTDKQGLYYSDDLGITWQKHPDIPGTATVKKIVVRDNIIVVAANTAIYLSTDSGNTFSNIGLENDFNFDACILTSEPFIEILAATYAGLQKYSTQTGSWQLVDTPLLNDQLIIGIGCKDSVIFCGTFANELLIKSDDGGATWHYIPRSPDATEIRDIAVDSNRIFSALQGTYSVTGAYNMESVAVSEDGGKSWDRRGPHAHGLVIKKVKTQANTFYLGTFGQGLFKTTDNFITYENVRSGNKLIGALALDNADPNFILISEYDHLTLTPGIYYSTDGAQTFQTATNFILPNTFLMIQGTDSIYAGADDGIYLSVDHGINWTLWNLAGENVLSLSSGNGYVFAGTEQGELYRINKSTKLKISGAWPKPIPIRAILFKEDSLFVGLSGAEMDTTFILNGSIWLSVDNGLNWENYTGAMESSNIYAFSVYQNNLLAATYGGGIYRMNDTVSALRNERPFYPEKIRIIKNYPNPFNARTSIRIRIPEPKIISLSIFDISGRLVKRLIHQKRLTGQYTAHWNGRDESAMPVASGFYFAVLTVDSRRADILKMLLVK